MFSSTPQVVIVGRPNVGKSSIFNWLSQRRIAIEDPTAGVTRDRLTQRIECGGKIIDLIDTGGMGFDDPDGLTEQIDMQIEAGLATAGVVVFVVDIRTGRIPADAEVAARLRQSGANVLLVANKSDDEKYDVLGHDFDELGFGSPIVTSTKQNRHRDELVEAITTLLPTTTENDVPATTDLPEMKVAIVGRRNVGKSTFVNALAKEERVIASPVAGTTRDSIDVRFEVDGHSFLAIDTPGLRRTKSRKSDIDFYSTHRAERSIRRADVVLMLFDATEPVGKVDKQLVDLIVEQQKPVLFVVNKWDLYAGDVERSEWAQYLRDTFRTMPWAPIAFVTAKTGRNVKAAIDTTQRLFRQSQARVPTAALNTMIHAATQATRPPSDRRGRPVRIYFATQVDTAPPTIVLSTSSPESITAPYKRYLLSSLRKNAPFTEVPIKILVRNHKSRE
ncbi:MAG: ribosome biogenesis GTPase Der [Planctomycetes bacterium]|nr:ribosome biogenesis GTPase Der [Planctomycetota bacterium]MBL6910706.1 ribosome biogenesis GTPase Der [Pirellulales bacterium]OUV73790.1 MAG: ribosome biogenesis GTPase Der [Planctomycetaceae bacterium TMED138]RZO65538.1 MAG: ribosome biogenesis GTPase Der [Phycisphaeraceae bacterium]HAO72418.1 ribosome biogenesis GTPase Der [Planctomycetaceae bacterium]|tara:strand:+ start:1065 stop:2405 length:1341 start_codon:yes stop_codon:yes gene_type:complete